MCGEEDFKLEFDSMQSTHASYLFLTIRFNVPLNTEIVAAALQSFSFCQVLCCCFAGELLF